MGNRMLLFGAGFHDNLGDDLILKCVDNELKVNSLDISYVTPLTKKLYFCLGEYKEIGLPMFRKYKSKWAKLKSMVNFITDDGSFRGFDTFVFYGGGYTNLEFGFKNLLSIYIIASKAHKMGLKVIFTGQTVGPCSTFPYDKILKGIYKIADKIYVREKHSHQLLLNYGLESELVADDAFLVYPYVSYKLSKTRVILNYKVFGNSANEKEVLFALYERVARFFSPDYLITVIPFRSEESSGEYLINEELYKYLLNKGYRVELKVEPDLKKFLNVFSEAKYVFGSAYHSIVLGKIFGAVVYSTYYDDYYKMKIGGFLDFYDDGDIFLPLDKYVLLEEADFRKEPNANSGLTTDYLYHLVKREWAEVMQ